MNQENQEQPTPGAINLSSPVERIYHAWDEALSRNDATALTALYAKDATIESPLVPHLMGLDRALSGHEEIRAFWEKLAERKPAVRQYYRTGYLTDGKKLMWEYPRKTPAGDQMDFVEVMELNREGLIQRYRVYWGWFGFGVLKRDEYHR
ncbi:MAG: nuclear transport factor 2 family protein [Bryobacterales bacterium]|nr:nuclear transport factor 2 family protein [Bryobacterales bacterium]